MKTYTLRSIAQRGTMLGAAVAIVAAAALPAASVFADALNPLTERSLLLSSSAPGFQDTDGSGNSYDFPDAIGANYAPAGSGPNGKKTGETFTFTASSSALIHGLSFQYCTVAAGLCQAPGNNTGDELNSDREDNVDAWPNKRSDFDFVGNFTEGTTPGTFEVKLNNATVTGWSFTSANLEDSGWAGGGGLTGKNNYVTLVNTTGQQINNGDEVQIIFRPTENIYITNPGANTFFVKINTYSSATSLVGSHNDGTPLNSSDTPGHTVVDGGVTVANVMTDSIHITTKVLETMAFSVGTRNPDTVTQASAADHGTCQAIEQLDNNRLQLGNPSAEYSLETSRAWDVFSYWRLSSNSSGGATVYYSGNTLANTVGDEIAAMETKAHSLPGTEQFGLGFVDAGLDTLSTSFQDALAQANSRYKVPTSYPFITVAGQSAVDPFDDLVAQPVSADYADATGSITGTNGSQGDAQFRFNKGSLTSPEVIAQQNTQVISCATAKMRYVANIGADTPAGVYTTKVNYLAAPQY